MTWLDVILVIFIGLMTYGGLRRGLILEFFDWVTVIVAGVAAVVLYRPVAIILSVLPWEQSSVRALTFFLIFGAVGACAMIGGLILDRNYKHTLGPYVNEVSGPILAFFKGFLLAYVLLLAISQMPLGAPFREAQAKAPVVQSVQSLVYPIVRGVLGAVASPEVARELSDTLKKARF